MFKYSLFFLLLISCKTTDNQTKNNYEFDLDTYEVASSKNYTLYFKTDLNSLNSALIKKTEILVLDNKDQSLAYGPEQVQGSVEWYDENQLIVKEYPERVKDQLKPDHFIYYIHIPTTKKVYKPLDSF